MANKSLISAALAVIFLLSFQTPLYSGVYKWVDDNGQIHYSDQPNEPDAEKFTLRSNTTTKPRSPSTGNKGTDDQGADKTTEDETKKPDEPEMVEIEPSTKEKRQLCNEAKDDLSSILSRGRLREIDEKGEYTYLSDEQRQQRISAAKKKQREFCR